MNTGDLEVQKLSDRIYRFQEDSDMINVDSYLICGDEKAVVIDGLQVCEGLYEQVCKLTDKPLFMVITHGHPDHAGCGMKEFMDAGITIYYPDEDYAFLETLYGEHLKKEHIRKLEDKTIFHLGNVTLDVMAMPGHTPGVKMLYYQEEKILFSSDAIGSGNIWMQLPESSPLHIYVQQLLKLQKFVKSQGVKKIYPGHSAQIKPYLKEEQDYLDERYLDEYTQLTRQIVDGTLVGKTIEIPMDIMQGIAIRQVTGKCVGEYCYDADKI